MSRQSIGRIQALVNAAVADYLVKADILPSTMRGTNLGSSSRRFDNVYIGDLHLQNERGNYTVVEEEDRLTIRNHKTGKLYKFVLEEIEEEK